MDKQKWTEGAMRISVEQASWDNWMPDALFSYSAIISGKSEDSTPGRCGPPFFPLYTCNRRM